MKGLFVAICICSSYFPRSTLLTPIPIPPRFDDAKERINMRDQNDSIEISLLLLLHIARNGTEETILRHQQQRLVKEGQGRISAYIQVVFPASSLIPLVSQLDGLTFTQFKKEVKNFTISFTPPLPEDAEAIEMEMKPTKFKVSPPPGSHLHD